MDANIFQVSAEETATGAYVRVILEVEYQRYLEVPLVANGLLYAPHDKLVCALPPIAHLWRETFLVPAAARCLASSGCALAERGNHGPGESV